MAPHSLDPVVDELGIAPEHVMPWGPGMAKVDLRALSSPRRRPGRGRLVLVSAITPTPAGEGKTTTSIGLADALRRLGGSVCLALREPSLGPCLGAKGGGTGGGRSELVPADRINLHFTGDLPAVTAAHNLLAALIDNSLHFGNPHGIDPRRVLWPRVIDMDDRALRRIVVGIGGPKNGVPHEGGFEITAASEVMAALCLAEDAEDLRRRLDRALVALTSEREPITASELSGTGAMLALLRDALHPNLVQTREGTPAFVHGGPFANIAHGCNSVNATRMALHHADWAITEAGFGFDLGAEKFFDIKCVSAGLDPAAVVLVATVRALKMHGGVAHEQLGRPDPEAVGRGLPNLDKHVESIRAFGEVPVVALNRFAGDTDGEIEVVRAHCAEIGVPCAVADPFGAGSEGTVDLARTVIEHAEREAILFRPLYAWSAPVIDKVRAVARTMYGARDVTLTDAAERDLRLVEQLGYAGLPVCIAKTQASLSDDPHVPGRPDGFDLRVRAIQVSAAAGFLVILTGNVLRMPGLPRQPRAEHIDLVRGEIEGLLGGS